MTNLVRCDSVPAREVLVARGRGGGVWQWYDDIEARFQPVGLSVVRVHTSPDAVRRVEQGGLAGAVLVTDGRRIDGLSLLRIIRSIDAQLPCWLVTSDTTRYTLQAALALRATSVIHDSTGARELSLALRNALIRTVGDN